MSSSFPVLPLSHVAQPIQRLITVLPGEKYRTIGVSWWGEGAYERETIDGMQTAAKTLTLIKENDLIINKIWVRNGSTAIASKKVDGCAASGEFPTFELDQTKVFPRWLHWITKTRDFWYKCDLLSRGTSGKNRIRPELFLTIEIPLPPLEEQRRIVARIEELVERIEEARGLRREAVEEAENIISNAARTTFEKLDKRHGANLASLNQVTKIFGGSTPSKANYEFWQGTIPWVSPKDMKVSDIYDSEDHISELALETGKSTLIPQASVLVVVRSGILRRTLPIAINRVPVTINQDMKALIPSDIVSCDFLAWWFRSKEDIFLEHVKGGTTVQSLMWDKVSRTPICIPSRSKQQDIVYYLQNLQTKVGMLKQHQAESATELDALLPSILDKAFKGEL